MKKKAKREKKTEAAKFVDLLERFARAAKKLHEAQAKEERAKEELEAAELYYHTTQIDRAEAEEKWQAVFEKVKASGKWGAA